MEVTVTGHSHSARGTLHYIYYGSYRPSQRKYNQAKANKYGITKRNEMVVGFNCHSGYKHALKDFNHYLRMKPKNRVQTLNVVLSFAKKDFDFRRPEHCFEAQTIARNFVKKAFPDHQAVIALQQDNGIPHVHCIINAISMQPPYKTIPGGHSKQWYETHPNEPYQSVNYGIEHLRSIGAKCIDDYENEFNHSITGITQRGQSTKASLNHIQLFMYNAVSNALNSATNKRTFRAVLRNRYGVNASFKHHKTRRRRKRGRRRRRTRYKRDGVVFRYDEFRHDKNGNIVLRKSGKPRVHRHYLKSSTLARVDPELSYRSILGKLHQNGIRRRHQRSLSAARKAQRASSVSGQGVQPSMDTSTSDSSASASTASAKTAASKARSINASLIAVASAHSMATLHKEQSIQRSIYDDDKRSLASYSRAYVEARNAKPDPAWKRVLNNSAKPREDWHRMERAEASRVTRILGRFHDKKAQRYAGWRYKHAIPAEVIGYGKEIPVFAIARYEHSLIYKLEAPIVDDFKKAEAWAKDKYRAGVSAVDRFMRRHHIELGDTLYINRYTHANDIWHNNLNEDVSRYYPYTVVHLAKVSTHFVNQATRKSAKKFHHSWHSIAGKFRKFVRTKIEPQPTPISRYYGAKNTSEAFSESAKDQMRSASSAYALLTSIAHINASEAIRPLEESERDWHKGFAFQHAPICRKAMITPPSNAASVLNSMDTDLSTQGLFGRNVARSVLKRKSSSAKSPSPSQNRNRHIGPDIN